MLTSVPTHVCLVKPISYKACPEIFNSDKKGVGTSVHWQATRKKEYFSPHLLIAGQTLALLLQRGLCGDWLLHLSSAWTVPELLGVPGHALHEKGLQRQKGAGPLVSSQEQRALLVLVINRGSTGCQLRVNR